MKKDKKIYHDGEFIGVLPKRPNNRAEANRYMSKQYEKYMRRNKEAIADLKEEKQEEMYYAK